MMSNLSFERLHRLLKRQLKRNFGGVEDALPPAMEDFIRAVDDAYTQSDIDRAMLERSLELTSQELLEAGSQMRAVYARLIESSSDGIFAFDRDCRYVVWNPAMERISGKSRLETLGKNAFEIFPYLRETGEEKSFLETLAGKTVTAQDRLYTVHGNPGDYEVTYSPLLDESGQITGGLAIIRDITERKRAEEERRAFEARLAEIMDIAADAIVSADQEQRIIVFNKGAEDIFGFKADEVIGRPLSVLLPPRFLERHMHLVRDFGASSDTARAMGSHREIFGKRKDGSEFPADANISKLTRAGRTIYTAILRDITDRKRAEQEIQQRADEIAALYETTRDLATHHEWSALVETIVERATVLLAAPTGAIYLYNADLDQLELTVVKGMSAPIGTTLKMGEGLAGRVAQSREPMIVDDYRVWEQRSAKYARVPFTAVLEVPMLYGGELVGVVSVQELFRATRKFTQADARLLSLFASQAAGAVHNARLFAQEQNRRKELDALYNLSRELADANAVGEILNLVTRRAAETVHSTFVRALLLENDELVVRAAFPIRVLDHELDVHRRQSIRDFTVCQRLFEQSEPRVLREDFSDLCESEREMLFLHFARTVCLVPLRVKEKPLGLLIFGEVRSDAREPFTHEKIHLARSVGDQAAGALHRASLREQTIRQATDLLQAYEATIEGWSGALDLRDRETEGHTQRVTQMTLRLAKWMGLNEDELIHMRRGALLHDIGKMGIPDGILLKPGTLDQEEWAIMRNHPEYAYALLSSIAYLEPALDIPYCHHEKWDGTGYPRGLKGEEIPLAARIFAIVDVWDALCSDRPYRKAWTEEKTREHIRAQAGTHFDPQVVQVFLRMLEEEDLDR